MMIASTIIINLHGERQDSIQLHHQERLQWTMRVGIPEQLQPQ